MQAYILPKPPQECLQIINGKFITSKTPLPLNERIYLYENKGKSIDYAEVIPTIPFGKKTGQYFNEGSGKVIGWFVLDSVETPKKDDYCYHISQYHEEVRELGEFKKWIKKTIYCGMDCPPYVDEVLVNISSYPRRLMKVEVEE